jgi:peroxiredoxin Q/BCP
MKIGQKAPEFSLKDRTGKSYSLKSFKGKYTVVYFYPKDDTPGCTIQAQRFTEYKAKFAKLNIDVIGISGGDEKSKEKFCKKQKLDLLLLSDTDFTVAKSYKSYGEKMFMGRKYQGIFRNTFLLDHSKKVVKIFEKVSVEDNASEILETVLALSTKAGASAMKVKDAKPRLLKAKVQVKTKPQSKKSPAKKDISAASKKVSRKK